jgi:hypothetical protein
MMMKLKAFNDRIICYKGDFDAHVTEAGIFIASNATKSQGISARWFLVWEVGPEIKGIVPGDWVLVQNGRWTEKFRFTDERIGEEEDFWRIDPEGCLAISKEKPRTVSKRIPERKYM